MPSYEESLRGQAALPTPYYADPAHQAEDGDGVCPLCGIVHLKEFRPGKRAALESERLAGERVRDGAIIETANPATDFVFGLEGPSRTFINGKEVEPQSAKCARGEHEADHVNGGVELQHVNGFPGPWAVCCRHCRCLYAPKES